MKKFHYQVWDYKREICSDAGVMEANSKEEVEEMLLENHFKDTEDSIHSEQIEIREEIPAEKTDLVEG